MMAARSTVPRMPAPLRHLDRGLSLYAYSDDVCVRCVRCDAPGRVAAAGVTYPRHATFHCASCGFALDSADGRWVGPVVLIGRRPCGHCGHRWLVVDEAHEGLDVPHAAERHVACPQCARASAVPVKAQPRHPADNAIDPHFGLPLLLAQPCRHGTVWAYNERHLHELRTYVEAKLRERRGTANRSAFSRLPAWIKAAKHRDDVLKAIGRLEAKLLR